MNLTNSYIQLTHSKIRYQQIGKGPDILFIHGCPGSVEDWDPMISTLSTKYKLTTYDRPGHGLSQTEKKNYSLENNAQTALELIKTLQLKNTLIVGHSYGAATALFLAIQNLPEIKGYVLIASPGYSPVDLDWITYILATPYLGRGFAELTASWIGPHLIKKGLLNSFAIQNANELPKNFLEKRIHLWCNSKVGITRSKELIVLEKELMEMSPHYKNIQKKVWIIQGKQDDVTKAAWKLNADIPNSQLIEFENTGHYPHWIQPSKVIDIIHKASSIKPGFYVDGRDLLQYSELKYNNLNL